MTSAIKAFDLAIERSRNFLELYELLHNNRSRRIREDWATKFRSIMHWRAGEKIARVDGHGGDAILVYKTSIGISEEHFNHDILSELLRSALVTSVSALDRYMHDLILEKCWKLLSQREDNIPKKLRELKIPVIEVRKATEAIRKDPTARPGGRVKKALQDVMHKEMTFQKAFSVENGAKMLGIKSFWSEVARRMPGGPTSENVKKMLDDIAKRRNQIVHESDLERKVRSRKLSMRPIKLADARSSVDWMQNFVTSIELVVIRAGV